MAKTTKDLLEFWEDQVKLSHTSSNYFFRKSPSHYHMMLLVMHAFKYNEQLTVETKLIGVEITKSFELIFKALLHICRPADALDTATAYLDPTYLAKLFSNF